jgi:hypothetical protein
LAAAPGSPSAGQAWFQPDGNTLPVVGALRQWVAGQEGQPEPVSTQVTQASMPHGISAAAAANGSTQRNGHSIQHYLLLPTYEWGIADWHLDVIRPFVKKYRPTIGFSLKEASQAARVTVIGGAQSFPEAVLVELRSANCKVEQISGDGTSIASQLATL